MPARVTAPLLLLGDVHARFDVIAAQIEHARESTGIAPCGVVVAGDLRENCFPVLEETVNEIKREVTHKTEA